MLYFFSRLIVKKNYILLYLFILLLYIQIDTHIKSLINISFNGYFSPD